MAAELESPPFGVRAVLLAMAAFFMGLLAISLLLTRKPPPPAYVVPPSAASVTWPEGFVEWEDVAAPSASGARTAPTPSASASVE